VLRTAEVQAATLASAEASVADARVNFVTALRGALIAVRSALSEADETLGIDNTIANDAFQNLLAVADAQSLIDASNAYERATESRDAAETVVFALPFSADEADLDRAYALAADALADASL